jgi:hypothetical protein
MRSLKIVDFTLMFLGGRARFEGSQVAAFAGFGVGVPRIKAVSAGFEFANHGKIFLRMLHTSQIGKDQSIGAHEDIVGAE